MKGSFRTLILAIGGLVVLADSGPARAHHAWSAEFDPNKPVTITGTVVKMEWTNPHCWLYVDVVDKDGKVVRWEVEFGVPNGLYRQGWKRSDLPAGSTLTVSGFLSRTSPNMASGVSVKMPDGRQLFSKLPDGGPER